MKATVKWLVSMCLVGCAFQCTTSKSTIYQQPGYTVTNYAGEEVFDNLSPNPRPLHQGKPFAKAGTINFVVIEGSAAPSNGKKSVAFSVQIFSELGEQVKVHVVGPECCVKQVDDHNFNFRVSGSLQFFRISFDNETGRPTIRTLNGTADMITVRYAVQKMW